ncbi:MAG: RidA family protein [Burkholderiales bacterium]|nr:MAG: RidA family protein [Burkholderiales bacterium]
MHKRHNPASMFPSPTYSHAIEVSAGARMLYLSGQIGRGADGKLVEGIDAQLDLAWRNVHTVLAEAGMDMRHVIKVNEYLAHPEHVAACRAKRAAVYGDAFRPATTLAVVRQLALPEILVEIEVVAAQPG